VNDELIEMRNWKGIPLKVISVLETRTEQEAVYMKEFDLLTLAPEELQSGND
jgi:hypothetical protein